MAAARRQTFDGARTRTPQSGKHVFLRKLSGLSSLLLGVAAIGLATAPVAHAATTIVVTTTADETVNDGNCSLEEAIQAANTDAPVDACPAGSGADTIVLAAGATYSLNGVNNNGEGPNGLPVVTSAITIDGNGASIVRSSGAPQFRLTVVTAGGGDLTFNDVYIAGFDAPVVGGTPGIGGVVIAHGNLTVDGSTLFGNRAEGPGGGVDARGGAIWADARLMVTNSTIANNLAVGTGGSVGGGIIIRPGSTVTIASSTFSGNSANVGRDFETETASLTVTDSIMASGCVLEGPVTDGGHNLDVNGSCGFSGSTDVHADPQLAAIANNGGPTPTQALTAGSPAIDAGGTCPVADGGRDQRGLPRFTPCDIGAFEVQDQAPVLAPTPGFTATEGVPDTAAVATLADADAPSAGDLTATIDWGDGSAPIAGTVAPIAGQPGHFTVNGTHTYTDEGGFTQRISAVDSDSGTVSITSVVTAVDAAINAAGGFTLSGTEGTALSGAGPDTAPVSGTVATFTDANPIATAADFAATTIDWGDGTSSAGTVTGPAGGPFTVSGAHSYAEDGTYAITVTIRDDGGSTRTATSSAAIADPPLPFTLLDILEDALGG
jgi:CSLREA domain-containing protein